MILQYKNNLCDIISSILVAENIEIAVDDINVAAEPHIYQ